MRFYSSYLNNHNYSYLPKYADFLLNKMLEDLAKEQVKLYYEVELPILKKLQHFTQEEIIQLTIISMREYLQMLAANKAKEQIEESLEKWKSDQLQHVGMMDIEAEDLTLINHVREKTFRKFIPAFTTDLNVLLDLLDEIDNFFTSSTTASINTYILILKNEIEKHERQLLEAQSIAHIGSYEWDMITGSSINSPEVYNIYEIEGKQSIDTFLENVHVEDREKVKTALENCYKSGHYESEYKYIINGKIKFIWARGKLIKNAEGKPEKLIGTIQDITERKNIENEILEKTLALERTNANLEQFAYAASHDLKEPIRKINIFSNMLKEVMYHKMDETEKNYFDKLERSAERMKMLVDNLLDYSQVNKQEMELEEIDLNNKIKNVLYDLEVIIKEERAVVEVDSLPTIKGHKRQLLQLFQNLIGNAIKYHKKGVPPQIKITCAEVSGKDIDVELPATELDKIFYLIEVKDKGIGFAQEDAEKIFNVFTRLHKKEYKGTGIGLSIAQKVVENHKGYIKAESKLNKGSVFKVYLPKI